MMHDDARAIDSTNQSMYGVQGILICSRVGPPHEYIARRLGRAFRRFDPESLIPFGPFPTTDAAPRVPSQT